MKNVFVELGADSPWGGASCENPVVAEHRHKNPANIKVRNGTFNVISSWSISTAQQYIIRGVS
jgi:hypothetical protein